MNNQRFASYLIVSGLVMSCGTQKSADPREAELPKG